MCVGRAFFVLFFFWGGGGRSRGAEAGREGVKKDMAARNNSCTGPERLVMLCRKGRCVCVCGGGGGGRGGEPCVVLSLKSRENCLLGLNHAKQQMDHSQRALIR